MSPAEEGLLQFIAEGRAMKAIALSQGTTAEAVADKLEQAQVTGWEATLHSYRLVEGGT